MFDEQVLDSVEEMLALDPGQMLAAAGEAQNRSR